MGSGGTPKATEAKFYNGDIPWLIIGDLNDGLVTKSEKKITLQGLENSSARWVERGSILLAMYGSIGKMGIAGMRCTTNQAIAFTQEIRGLEPKYLFYYLLSQRRNLLELGKGGTQPNISQTILKEVPIPLAPLEEQRRIVAKLDEVMGKIETARARLERVPRVLKRFRQSVLAAACSGRLTADWRMENGVELEDWRIVTLESVLAEPLCDGRSVTDREGGFPVLRLTCLRQGKILLSERKAGAWTREEAKRFMVKRNDFFIARGNGSLALVGRGGLVKDEPDEVAFPDTMIRVRPKTKELDPEFLAFLWDSSGIRIQIEFGSHFGGHPQNQPNHIGRLHL